VYEEAVIKGREYFHLDAEFIDEIKERSAG